MSTDDLIHYYKSVIRPVMEYGSTVWTASLTEDQSHRLDAIQRRAEKIIDMSYATHQLSPLKQRRDDQAKKFFQSLLEPSSCLHHILPDERNPEIISRLRSANKYPVPFARTERFRHSFVVHGLAHYQ